jgi:signal transduction histidine kinase
VTVLHEGPLPGPQRLQDLAAEFEGDTGVPCQFVTSGEPRPLGGDCHLTLYRVAQEALTNIRKHACPERVTVQLDYEPSGTRLSFEDFEFQAGGVPPGGGTGYGLAGMRERAALLGGRLSTGPTEHGFRVGLRVPG